MQLDPRKQRVMRCSESRILDRAVGTHPCYRVAVCAPFECEGLRQFTRLGGHWREVPDDALLVDRVSAISGTVAGAV